MFLAQGWSAETRAAFYQTTQGSRMLPYEWVLHLEQPASQERYADAENMRRMGFLVDGPSPSNPDGLPVGKIGERLGTAPATLSFHLKELARADLVTTRHEGRFIYCSANFATMNGLLAYLTENCCGGTAAYVPLCEPVACEPLRKESP